MPTADDASRPVKSNSQVSFEDGFEFHTAADFNEEANEIFTKHNQLAATAYAHASRHAAGGADQPSSLAPTTLTVATLPVKGANVHGHVALSAPTAGAPFSDPNKISLSPFQGGGLMVKNSVSGLWEYVDFTVQNSIEGDRTNAYLNGVAGQVLTTNTFYYVGIKKVGATWVMNFGTAGQTKTADTFVDVFVGDAFTSLVGYCFTLNNSFLFDPFGRSVVSNFFNTANRLGVMSPPAAALTTTSLTYVKLGAGLDLFLTMNGSNDFFVEATGYCSNSLSGETCFIQIRPFTAAEVATDVGTEGAGTSVVDNAKVPISSVITLSFGLGYYRFEVWGKVTGGTGTFTLQNTALILSA